MSKKAMKLALEALEANSLLVNGNNEKWGLVGCMDGYYSVCFDIDPINKQTNEAITALREALAEQPAQQEPVAKDNSNYRLDQPGLDPLYASPPAQRKPLD